MPEPGEVGERKAAVLKAVVEAYVRTGEPVGSETLADAGNLGVSAATIRNEMSALEELGYLGHPHTSAGRVPTDLGYRHFVDGLPQSGRLREFQKRSIADFFAQTVLDLEEVLRGATQLLSRLTEYAGLAVPPNSAEEQLAHVEFISIGTAVLALVVGQRGRVDKRILELPGPMGEQQLAALSRRVGAALSGLTVGEAEQRARTLAAEFAGAERDLVAGLADGLSEMREGAVSEHMLVGGVANLAGEAATWHRETVARLFEALERESEMLGLLRRAEDSDVSVTIGREHPSTGEWDASLVVAPYRSGETSLGAIGIVGPTRMDYLNAISAVRAVARRISELATALGA